MNSVRQIIQKKGNEVATINGNSTVKNAAVIMNERHIGALVVTEDQKAVGIFTERDILNRIVAQGQDPATTLVKDVMTTPMACCRRDTSVEECKTVMSQKRIRHLPVVEDGTLYGMISTGDILANEVEAQQETIEYLHASR
ncbi:MAG: CBS domain-containing protein [Phycisphaerae bacterium]